MATEGVLPWLRRNLFADWKNTLGTLIVLALLVRYLPPLLDWAVFNAVARPDNAACRAIGHAGACWGVIAEKYRLILFGRYPYDEQWRPLVATALMIALLAASCYRPFWSRWLIVAWTRGARGVLRADDRRRVRPHASSRRRAGAAFR